MVQDLIDRNILSGKTEVEVQALLGPHDDRDPNWYGYNVRTLARCDYWKCFLNVNFASTSARVQSTAVSD